MATINGNLPNSPLHAALEALLPTSKYRLQDPVTSGEMAAKLSFQELATKPLGCYSKRTSSTTYSNACLWLGTKNNFVSNKRPTSITRCFRDLLIRRVLPATSTFRRTCLACAGELSPRRVFSANGAHKTTEIL